MPMNKSGKAAVRPSAATLQERCSALAQLGSVFALLGDAMPWPGHACGLAEAEYSSLDRAVREAVLHNGWATEENVRYALRSWAVALEPEHLERWVRNYPRLAAPPAPAFRVGLILAGNVPLVGLHDVLCIWLSGHAATIKCSSQEPGLIPAILRVLGHWLPDAAAQLTVAAEKLGAVDAVIATGSNNTARYFEHYFGHLPRIVRRSRVSVAVLDGSETREELEALGEDVFRYFGLGCRNVSKVYLPQDFPLDRLFNAFYGQGSIVQHNKYANNYDYTRALWLLDGVKFLDNGFLLVRETDALPSAVATLHVERYSAAGEVEELLRANAEAIQCVVGHGHVPFGSAQHPALWDYADNVDTLAFLIGLSPRRQDDPL